MKPLQKLVCTSCGATLPAVKTAEGAIRCAHCGALYLPPQGQGGVHISSGSSITIKGDLVGGDKIVHVDRRPRSLGQRLLAALRLKGKD